MGLRYKKHMQSVSSIYTATDAAADWRFFARLHDGRALVSCHARNAVLIVDTEGKEIGRLECEFAKPEGIAVNSKGVVFVVDRHHRCIFVFGPDLKHQRSIVSDLQDVGPLNQPVGIAISSVDDSVWVADNENHRVLQFDEAGKYISTLGNGYGSAPGNLFCPCGIALYNHASHGELVVVSEWGGGRVQVFKAGQVFSIYAGVQHAHHVVVDAHGSVYVTEYATRKIKRFSLDGELVGGGEWATSAVSLVAGDAGIDIVVAQQHVMRLLVGNYRKRAKYDAAASM
jgi:DNA-binding beta-propeller fold protein YncE